MNRFPLLSRSRVSVSARSPSSGGIVPVSRFVCRFSCVSTGRPPQRRWKAKPQPHYTRRHVAQLRGLNRFGPEPKVYERGPLMCGSTTSATPTRAYCWRPVCRSMSSGPGWAMRASKRLSTPTDMCCPRQRRARRSNGHWRLQNPLADRRPARTQSLGRYLSTRAATRSSTLPLRGRPRVGQGDAQVCVTQELLEVGRIAPLGIERVEQGLQLPRSELQHSRHS